MVLWGGEEKETRVESGQREKERTEKASLFKEEDQRK